MCTRDSRGIANTVFVKLYKNVVSGIESYRKGNFLWRLRRYRAFKNLKKLRMQLNNLWTHWRDSWNENRSEVYEVKRKFKRDEYMFESYRPDINDSSPDFNSANGGRVYTLANSTFIRNELLDKLQRTLDDTFENVQNLLGELEENFRNIPKKNYSS